MFRIFGLLPGLDSIAISLRDVIAAIAGSLLLVVAFWLWRRFKKAELKEWSTGLAVHGYIDANRVCFRR